MGGLDHRPVRGMELWKMDHYLQLPWGARTNVREERMGLTGLQYLTELHQNKAGCLLT